METINIHPGTALNFIKTDKFKMTVINVLITRPLSRQEVTLNSLIPSILKNECDKYDSLMKLNKAILKLCGASFDAQVIKKGEHQILHFYMEILGEGYRPEDRRNLFDEAVRLLGEIILRPKVEMGGFSEKIVDIEVNNLRAKIEGRKNNKAEYAKLRTVEEMCKHEAFGVYGDGYLEDLNNKDLVTPRKLMEHYQKILKESQIDFLVIGNEDKEQMISSIQAHFPKREAQPYNPLPFSQRMPMKINRVEEQEGGGQGNICITLRCDVEPASKDFYSLCIANEILGGSGSSRLFKDVRENQSLCYSIGSFIYRFKSVLFVQSGVDKENFSKVFDAVEGSIKDMQKNEVSFEELEGAKKGMTKYFTAIKDYLNSLGDFYFTQRLLGDSKSTIDDFVNKISLVSTQDIKDIMNKLEFDTVYTLS